MTHDDNVCSIEQRRNTTKIKAQACHTSTSRHVTGLSFLSQFHSFIGKGSGCSTRGSELAHQQAYRCRNSLILVGNPDYRLIGFPWTAIHML